jgi:hypothetical protein
MKDERIAIHHPQDPNRVKTIWGSDFDPEVHRLWMEDVSEGYRIEHRGPWHTIIGPDGEKVGTSTMDRDEAEDRLEALTEGEDE